MRKIHLITITPLTLFLLAGPVLAQEPDYDTINDIAKELNCPTCTGINLSDCRTQTCEQWRDQIGSLVEEGYEKQEVLDYFSSRYGPQVLQEPPKQGFTLTLWLLPGLALLAGGVWLAYTIRAWRKQQPQAASSTTPVQTPTATTSPDRSEPPDDYLSQVDKDLGKL